MTPEACGETEPAEVQQCRRFLVRSHRLSSVLLTSNQESASWTFNDPWFHCTKRSSTLLTPNRRTFGVIVSVIVRSDEGRHFGLSSRQRTSRTRGVVTRCRKIDLGPGLSGSGESWFEPRRGNRKRPRRYAGGRFRCPSRVFCASLVPRRRARRCKEVVNRRDAALDALSREFSLR
jgi:hypothetical protein